MRRGVFAVASLFVASLMAAPGANAVCLTWSWQPGTQGACPEEYAGTLREYLSEPSVEKLSSTIAAIANQPFLLRSSQEIAGGDGEMSVTSTFVRNGVTRRSTRATSLDPGEVTYLNATRSCRREISKAMPNTIAADAKATWKCRSRKSSDVDGTAELQAWLPARVIGSTADGTWPGGTWLVPTTGKSEYAAQGLLLGYVLGTVGSETCARAYSYEATASGYAFSTSQPPCSVPESSYRSVTVSTTDIPVLANMAKFKVK